MAPVTRMMPTRPATGPAIFPRFATVGPHLRLLLTLCFGVLCTQAVQAAATTRTWSGGGADNNWSTVANWGGTGVPNDNDTIIFPAAAARFTSNNNLAAGLKLNQITFNGAGYTVTGNQIVLTNPGAGGGFLMTVAGTNTVALPVVNSASTAIDVNLTNAGARLIFNGVFSGAKDWGISGAGVTEFNGANIYTGQTTIYAGATLIAGNNAALGTAAGNTVVSAGATLGFQNGVTVSEPISTSGAGALGVGAFNNVAGSNTYNGALTLTGATSFGSSAGTLTMASPIGGAVAITKVGSGTVVFSNAANTYTGTTAVNAGTLLVTGSLAAGAGLTTVNNGGTLGGTGTVRAISAVAGGTINPGVAGPGTLNSGNATFAAGATFAPDLNGTAAGQFDQLNVTGTVNLGGATPVLTFGYTPALGDSFTIVNNDGGDAIVGTFSGQPEGTALYTGGYAFTVSYIGGTGNDVTLTRVRGITARETVDADSDGHIDAIRMVSDSLLGDNFASVNITVVDGAYSYVVSGYDTGGVANDNEFFVRLTERALPPDTGDTGVTPAVTVVNGGSLGIGKDAVGVAATDKAKPVLLAADWINVGSSDGVDAGDTVTLTFSEPVTTNGVIVKDNNPDVGDIGLPVTNDSFGTSTIANVGPSTTIDMVLAGVLLLTPGGTYAPSSTTLGNPTGVFINDGTRILDSAAVPNSALNQTIGTAVDLRPGGAGVVAIAWSDHTIPPKVWDISTDADYGASYKASTATPPLLLGVINSGTVRCKFDLSCSISSPSGWTLTTAPGLNQFCMTADPGPTGVFSLDLATGPKRLENGVYSGHGKGFDLQFTAPTQINVGQNAEQSITITVVVTPD